MTDDHVTAARKSVAGIGCTLMVPAVLKALGQSKAENHRG